MSVKVEPIPKAFIGSRIHSLSGLWFVLFLIEHLITHSQVALLFGESAQGFFRAANFIHNLPYFTVIEVGLVGVPLLIHLIWSVKYALTSSPNSEKIYGIPRNRADKWQKISLWLMIPLLALHIVQFRFLEYPKSVNIGSVPTYFTTVSADPGLYALAARLDVKLLDQPTDYAKIQLKPGEVIATAPTFGAISLLGMRDTLKSPFWVAIYTVFVFCTCFYAFNGLWTSIISWRWMIVSMRKMAIGLLAMITFLGLIAVWGSF